MYIFAVVALLALATVKLVDFLVEFLGDHTGMRTLLTYVLAIGGVWLIDFSMLESWGIAVRDHSIGVWMTGFIVAGVTSAWRALFGYLTHDRATVDETLGEHRELRKVA
ncbi:MAG: hypothetical protein N2037_08230 [Acidimicrobiales bacterium]|nr:hypothetical protein [Acidimicrobiales bacterium]